jgi:hypothetical protein
MLNEIINPLENIKITPSGTTATIGENTSNYSLIFPEDSPGIMKDMTGSKVEDLSQEDLRKIYLNIKAGPGKRLYSSSDLKELENNGRFREDSTQSQSDSLFIGDQVHKAMETNGANLKLLKCAADLGASPIAPEKGLSKSKETIALYIGQGMEPYQAYCNVMNNMIVKKTKHEEITSYYESLHKGEEFEPSKELTALIKKADKDMEDITPAVQTAYNRYAKEKKAYDTRLSNYFEEGDIILDDLPFRKISSERMLSNIHRAYNALKNDSTVLNYYEKGVTGNCTEKWTEYVALWEHTTPSGIKVNCKSMFDRVVFDKPAKIVTVLDIKTHSYSAKQFVYKNYKDYQYYQSMSFYKEAIISLLREMGEDPDEWGIYMVLLPVGVESGRVGCHYPVAVISGIDLESSKMGGWFKPFGSIYNQNGEVQVFMSSTTYDFLNKAELVHKGSVDLFKQGWTHIIDNYEQSLTPKII